jgi:hypothetical protein
VYRLVKASVTVSHIPYHNAAAATVPLLLSILLNSHAQFGGQVLKRCMYIFLLSFKPTAA